MVDTAPYFPLLFESDAEPPPSRSPPSSWKPHAGGLLWPDVIGQRDQRVLKPAGEHAERVFSCVNTKKQPENPQDKDENEQSEFHNRL
jgi:hypothetical protein